MSQKWFSKKNIYYVGSGSSALYIYLKSKKIVDQKILCPSNICYSIPFSIVYSQNNPLFFDVDKFDGNCRLSYIIDAINSNSNVAAIVLPHMYGNLIEERDKIISFCHSKNIKVIEDFASAIGIEVENQNEILSDASIFSFGKKKHIELGYGGILNLDEVINIKSIETEIESNFAQHTQKVDLFDSMFKNILYSDYYDQLIGCLASLNDFVHKSFVYKYQWTEKDKKILNSQLNNLKAEKERRLKLIAILNHKIEYNSIVKKYKFNKGSNPWRFNLLIMERDIKIGMIRKMLHHGLPISVWYPPIDPLFQQEIKNNSKFFSEKIINLSISNLNDLQINEFIKIVNNI